MTLQNVLDFWGDGQLYRWPPEALHPLRISKAAKQYLGEVGLPRSVGKAMHFGDSQCARVSSLDELRPHLRIIGWDLSRAICLDESQDGHVVWVDRVRNTRKFINTSVELFGFCLTTYFQRLKGLSSVTWSLGRQIEEELENQIRLLDEPALENVDNFWPMSLEQLGT